MKRFFKWFFGIVFFLVILVVGTVVALPYLIDPNEYKPEIIAQLKPHLKGRELQIPGDIKLSIFPWLGAEIGEVVIGNADGFVLKPFMTIQHSKAEVKILSLFSDELEIGSLILKDIKLNLQQDAEGRNNWSDLASTNQLNASPKSTNMASVAPVNQLPSGFIKVTNSPAAPTATGKFELPPMKIAGVHLVNMRIELDDKKSQDVITLYKMNLDAGPLNQFNPIPLKGKFQLNSKKHEILAASAFASTLELTPQLNDFTLKSFNMNTNVTGKGVQNQTIKTSLKVPNLKLETQKEKITAKPFYLKLDNINSEGRFTMRRFKKPIIRLGWEISELNLDKLLPKIIPAEKGKEIDEEVVIPEQEAIPEIAEMVTEEPQDTSAHIFAPLALFANTDMQGTLSIGHLVYKKIDFKKFKVNLLARGGTASALPTAELYGGKYEGDLHIQTLKQQATRVRSKQKLINVPVGPLMKALYGKDTVVGKMNFQGQFFSTGETQKALTENLSGDGQFNIHDAEVKTLDVKKLILKENYDKLGFAQEKTDDKQVTVFDKVRGTIRAKQGIFYNKDFTALSRRVHLKGKGYADLNEQTVKYTVTTIPKKSLAFSFGGRKIELRNKDINTHLTGPWSNIDVDNDLEEVIKAEFKQTELYQKKRAKEDELKAKLKAEEDKLKQKLKDKLKF